MIDRRLSQVTRRMILGAGLFAGASWVLQSCTNSSQSSSGSSSGSSGNSGKLVAASYPGSFDDAYRNVLATYFAKATGATAIVTPMLALEEVAKVKAAPNSPPLDILLLDDGPLDQAPKDEILQKFPVDLSQHYGDLLTAYQNKANGWGPTVTVQAIGIGYNPKTVKTPPKSWDDLWKAEYKGRVGLATMESSLGTAFMVQYARLKGGDEDNIDTAFAALKTLLPNVGAVAKTPGALTTLFQQGEVDIAPQYYNSIASLKEKGVDVEWVVPEGGGVGVHTTMHVVKHPNIDPKLAAAYIDAAISPDVQTTLAEAPYYFVPTNSKVKIPEAMAMVLGSDLTAIANNLNFLDWQKINKNRDAWLERFNQAVKV